MSTSLGQLPQELLLDIFRYIRPQCMQIILSSSRQAVYEIETPEWQTLRSLRLTSRHLCGPAFEALSEAEGHCNTLSIDLFHLRGGGRFKHRVPDVVFQTYADLVLTIPLHFTATLDATTSVHALYSFTFTLSKFNKGVWVSFPSLIQSVVELIPTTTTGPTTLSSYDRSVLQVDLDIHHIGLTAPFLTTIRVYAQGGLNFNTGLLTPRRLTNMLL